MILNTGPERKPLGGDDNLIPLINVVFLMLIFFMVAGHITKSDKVKLMPPNSVSDTQSAEAEKVVLAATHDDQIYLDDQPITQDKLSAALTQAFEQSKAPEKFSVLVKVDADLPVEKLQALLKEVKAAGLTHVSLATRLIPEAH